MSEKQSMLQKQHMEIDEHCHEAEAIENKAYRSQNSNVTIPEDLKVFTSYNYNITERQLHYTYQKIEMLTDPSLKRKGDSHGFTAYNFYIKDLSQGVSTSFLREAQLWRGIEASTRATQAVIDDSVDRQMIVWTQGDKVPKLSSSYYMIDVMTKKAWLYQVVKVIATFHSIGRPYQNVILPHLLMTGWYSNVAHSVLSERKFQFPSLMSLLANDLMRLGNYMPGTCTLLTHVSPEELLGDLKPSSAKDLWMLGHLIYNLFEGKPLIRDEETDSKFAHLMKIFKICGTPTESTWPNVSKLPHYNRQYPQWKEGDLKQRLSSPKIPKYAQNLIMDLLVLNPKKRLSASGILAHEFFRHIRKTPQPTSGLTRSQAKRRRLDIRASSTGATDPDEFSMEKNVEKLLDVELKVEEKEGISQKSIDDEKRSVLINWLSELSQDKKLSQDAYHVAIQILDLVIDRVQISLADFQNVGMCCLLIASKVVDTVRLTLDELADIAEEEYTVRQVRNMELKILKCVSPGEINIVTPVTFLRCFLAQIRSSHYEDEGQTEALCMWLIELLITYVSTRRYRASTITLAALMLATSGDLVTEPATNFGKAVLPIYSESSFKDCITKMRELWKNFSRGPRGEDWSTYRQPQEPKLHIWKKYSSSLYRNVAAIQPIDIKTRIITSSTRTLRRDPATVLPTVVTIRLLMFLDKPEMCLLSCVSKKWHSICYNPRLSRGTWDFKRHKEVITSKNVGYLLNRLSGVQELSLFRCRLTANAIFNILDACKSLKKLDLSYTICDTETQIQERKHNGDLKDVVTQTNAYLSVPDSNRYLLPLPPIALAEGHSSPPQMPFPSSRPASDTFYLDEKKQSLLSTASSLKFSNKISREYKLQELNLRKSEVVEDDLKDVGLAAILRCCVDLRCLNLGMLQCVETETIKAICELPSAEKLEEIHLNSCPNVMNKDLDNLSSHCPGLKRLYLDMCSKVNDSGITAIARKCPLEVLSLCANRVSDTSLQQIAEHCKNLRQLELSFCYLVSTDGVLEIADKCRKITHLNLCLVDMIQDNAIEALAQKCELEELNLRGCTHITDNALHALARHCKKLRVLHLLGCEKISASTVTLLKVEIPWVKIIIW
eukprot:CAMPEP_0167743712 /NCGR_PEP_ID=MMETSP0110_2-20121227/2166_1 /TAXON_ID=629695 /ORGANISM="Gymnochlora sp., Strain CCMP2014" /LENGTH=1116 /DNA_ID=CAMNT_0007628109 /DNA_START=100 /DNA_END=3450 /DNA_ORIENTATION=+